MKIKLKIIKKNITYLVKMKKIVKMKLTKKTSKKN